MLLKLLNTTVDSGGEPGAPVVVVVLLVDVEVEDVGAPVVGTLVVVGDEVVEDTCGLFRMSIRITNLYPAANKAVCSSTDQASATPDRI